MGFKRYKSLIIWRWAKKQLSACCYHQDWNTDVQIAELKGPSRRVRRAKREYPGNLNIRDISNYKNFWNKSKHSWAINDYALELLLEFKGYLILNEKARANNIFNHFFMKHTSGWKLNDCKILGRSFGN